MRLFGAFAYLACLQGGCHGPVEDHGRIASTALIGGERVAIAYHDHRYRPATGLAAFPDGGIPQTVRDRFVVALVARGVVREIARFGNDALPGSGSVSLRWFPVDPAHIHVTRSGQQTTSLPLRYFNQQLRLDLSGHEVQRFDLRAELARVGRTLGADGFGDFHPVAADGILLVGASQGDAKELWLRTPAGALRRLLAFDRFERQVGDDIVYSTNGPPLTMRAFNLNSRVARPLLRYTRQNTQQEWQARDDPAFQQISRPRDPMTVHDAVSVGDDGRTLHYVRDGRELWAVRVEF